MEHVKFPKSKRAFFHTTVKIGRHLIGEGHPCFIIAEAGSNHNQRWDWAKKLIDVAAKAHADAVKFQTFVPEKIYVKDAGFADYLGKTKTVQEIFEEIMMPPEWLPKLAAYCRKKSILFLTSVFDEESADLVDPHVPAHKIASYECTHIPLIRHVAKKGKPVFLSTAMATIPEIGAALDAIASTGNKNVVLMHCIAKYPAPIEASNLRVVETLRRQFNVPVGLSDHSREPVVNPVALVARGGNILEKHLTLSNDLPGPDHVFALEPSELEWMIASVRKTESALGSPVKRILPMEKELWSFARRHVHAIRDIAKGERFTRENIAVLRSGKAKRGLEPARYDWVLGKCAARDLRRSDGIGARDIK